MAKSQSINNNEWVDITEFKQCDSRWAFRKYTCPKYIFSEEYSRDEIKRRILNSHRIKDTIEKRKRETGTKTSALVVEATKIIDEIAHAFSLKAIRLMAYMLIKIFKRLFQRVLINKDGIEKFRQCTEHTPVVLVPTHSSYFDFLIASAICFALDLPLPAIVSGQDFLHIAVVNHLLRSCGAFYMRRSFASDVFYKNIFTEYVQQVLSLGERPIEFFPEGTRSRSGKALQPKLGLLNMVLESCFHGFVQDVSFIPISISYEKITEEMLYTYELLGIPKPKESLKGLLKARSVLQTDYGTVCVTLGEPMCLREYCLKKIDGMDYVRIPRCERHLKIFGREAEEMQIAKYFGEKLIYTQQQNMVIYPRPIVTFLMMNKTNLNTDSMVSQVVKIERLLKIFGYCTFGFEEFTSSRHAILQAVKFSDQVMTHHDGEKISSTIAVFSEGKMDDKATSLYEAFGRNRLLIAQTLAYIYSSCQRNKLIHACLLPSLLAHCVRVEKNAVQCFQMFAFLKWMFRAEFIFDPDSTVEQDFNKVKEHLQTCGVLSYSAGQMTIIKDKSDEMMFLLELLQPFIDAYMIILVCVLHNSYEFPCSLKDLTKELQLQAAKFINSVQMTTYEPLSLQTLSNIVTSFCKNGQFDTVKNEKFETLVNGVIVEKMTEIKRQLAPFVSAAIGHRLSRSKL